MEKINFRISESTTLIIDTPTKEYNIDTFNLAVDLKISEKNTSNEKNIGGYHTLFEVLTEFEDSINDVISNRRIIGNNDSSFSLIKDLNKEYYNFYSTEDGKYLDSTDNLLRYILFSGDYYVGLYNYKNEIIMEIGPAYSDFEIEETNKLAENFSNWFKNIEIVKYKINQSALKDWTNILNDIIRNKVKREKKR